MTGKQVEELKSKVESIFKPFAGAYDDFRCRVSYHKHTDSVEVEVVRMYEYLPLSFDTMMKLAEVFGTKDFKVNQWSSSGCETCDYGSSYRHEFSYKLPKEV